MLEEFAKRESKKANICCLGHLYTSPGQLPSSLGTGEIKILNIRLFYKKNIFIWMQFRFGRANA